MSRTTFAAIPLTGPGICAATWVCTFIPVTLALAQSSPQRDDRAGTAGCAENRPPVARAGADITGTVGQAILFDGSRSRDFGRGTITAYTWNFADGSQPANGFRVYHSFAGAGSYEVTLTVTDDCGATHSDVRVVTVLGDCQSNLSPTANAGPDRNASVNQTLTFDGSASTDSDGQIVEHWWNFGDGNFTGWQNAAPVSHAYASPGSYSARLWVRDNCGQMSASDLAVITVSPGSGGCSSNVSPGALINGPTSGSPNQLLSFSGSGSSDADGQIVAYHWSFGDGVQQSGSNVTHAYTQSGSYIVSLTVTDNCGATATATHTVSVQATGNCTNNTPPVANAGPDRTAIRNAPITLDGSASTDTNGQVVQFWWNFGEGSFTGWQDSPIAIHTYLAAGDFLARLWVRDNCGAMSSSDVAAISVAPAGGGCEGNVSPEAAAGDDREGHIGEAITFSAAGSFDPDGQIQSYHWLFSDGQEANGMTATRAFLVAGTFLATLTVTDNCGAQDVDVLYTEITAPNPCGDDLTVSISAPAQGTVNQDVSFSGTSSANGELAYAWNFGDGTSATGQSVQHSYATPGSYTTTVTVTQSCGTFTRNASASAVIQIDPPNQCSNNSAPIAMISGPTTGVAGVTLSFSGEGSLDFTGSIVAYAWNFGDGQQASGMQVSHAYASAGSFNLALTVTDQCGLSHTSTRTLTITNPGNQPCGNGNAAPVANAGPDRQVPTQQNVTFDASASTDADGQVTQYWWNFGDGEYTNWVTTATVPHAYAGSGTYEVRLWVKDNCGNMSAPDVAVVTASNGNQSPCANNTSPSANAGPDREGSVNVPVSFTGSGYDPDGQIVQYKWGFGDGHYTPWQTTPSAQHTYVSAGQFTATLQVKDNCGAESSLDASLVSITQSLPACFNNQAPTANAGPNLQGNVNVVLYFSGLNSSDPEGQPLQYKWNFGNGTETSWVTSSSHPHTYTQPGTYTATLRVKDPCDAESAPSTTTVTISSNSNNCAGNTTPVADGGPDRSVVVNVPVTFNGTGSYDAEGQTLSYWWNFGDGAFTGWQPNAVVEHTYASTGNYYAKLWVRDSCGATSPPDTMYMTVTNPPVNCTGNQPPTANAGNAPDLDVNEVHVFTAAGSSDPNHSLDELTFLWNFGDGTSATGYSVAHSYSEPGTYMVSLMVTDPCGRGAVATDSVNVIDSAAALLLTADFTVWQMTGMDYSTDPPTQLWDDQINIENEQEIELGRRVKFIATSSSSNATFLWNFGDTTGTGVSQTRAFQQPGTKYASLTVVDPSLCGPCSYTVVKQFVVAEGMKFLSHTYGSSFSPQFYALDGNDIWAVSPAGQIGVCDLSDPHHLNQQPIHVMPFPPLSHKYAAAFGNGLFYVAQGPNGVGVFRADRDNFAEVFHFHVSDLPALTNGAVGSNVSLRAVEANGAALYIAAWPYAILTFDMTNPANPVFIGSIPTPMAVGKLVNIDNQGLLAYKANSGAGNQTLILVDIRNPLSPQVSQVYETGMNLSQSIHVHGRKISILSGTSGGWQLSEVQAPEEPSAPLSIAPLQLLLGSGGGVISNSRIYSLGTYGFSKFDYTDPSDVYVMELYNPGGLGEMTLFLHDPDGADGPAPEYLYAGWFMSGYAAYDTGN